MDLRERGCSCALEYLRRHLISTVVVSVCRQSPKELAEEFHDVVFGCRVDVEGDADAFQSW